MKPELQEKLVDYLGTLEDAVKTGSDFVAEQAPLVVQEYLAWCFWEAVVWASAWAIAAIVAVALWVVIWRHVYEYRSDKEMLRGVSSLLIAPSLFGACCIVVANALTALQITIAPRVFLLERIAELVK